MKFFLFITLEQGISIKKLREGIMGEGGTIGPLPSTFDTIHPTDLIFGQYNELSSYFQLNETTWCLIGFHDNHSCIKTSQAAAVLAF